MAECVGWTRLLRAATLTLMVPLLVTAATSRGTTYKLMAGGGETADGTYTTHYATYMQCLILCQSSACLVVAWDSQSNECRVFTAIIPTTARLFAPSTLTTYYLVSDPLGTGQQLVFTGPITGKWSEARTTCVSRGGDLASPFSAQYAFMLHSVSMARDVVVGLVRDSITAEYKDTAGNLVLDITWDTGEPDLGNQFFSFLRDGNTWDIDDRLKAYDQVACMIP